MNVDSEVLYIALLFILLTMNPHNKKQKENLYIITYFNFQSVDGGFFALCLNQEKDFPHI